MAGPLSTTARAKSLANDFGLTRGPNSPDAFKFALYDADPEFDGTELDNTSCPGYVQADVDSDDFVAIDGGMAVSIDLADSEGAWTRTARFGVLLNASDPTEVWDYCAIQPIRVREAGEFDPLIFTVFYADDATTP